MRLGVRLAIVPVLLAALALVACGGGGGGGSAAPESSDPPDSPGGFPPGDGTPCATVPTFEDGKSPTLEIHVDVDDGSDADGDGSADRPYASIGRGARDLVPGAALRIHAGTYPGGTYLSDLAGTPAAPIWIGGAPGESAPVIHGGGEGLHLTRVRWLVLHDLEIENATSNGVNCDDGGDSGDPDATRHVIFRDLLIRDIGTGGNQDSLKLSGVDDYVVLDCRFRDGSAGGSGIDHVGCHGGLIARCDFRRMGSNSIQCKGGSEDIEIRWCTFVDGGARGVNIGGSTGDAYFRPPLSTTRPNVEARDIRLLGCSFRGGEAAFAFVGAVDCVAAHNTIVSPHRWLFRILQEKTSDATYEFLETRDCEVTNNLWYFDRSDLAPVEYVNVGPNTRPETYAYRHNLWYAFDDPSVSQPPQIIGEVGGIVGHDPLLANPHGGDVSLAPTSPARGAGATQAWLAAGLGGVCFTDPPNVGARE